MAHSRKVDSVVPTSLFTDGDYYYGIVGDMILRTQHITKAVFHTTQESPAVSVVLTKYGIVHQVHPSDYRNEKIYLPAEFKKPIQVPVDDEIFCIVISPLDMINYRADRINLLNIKTQLSCQH